MSVREERERGDTNMNFPTLIKFDIGIRGAKEERLQRRLQVGFRPNIRPPANFSKADIDPKQIERSKKRSPRDPHRLKEDNKDAGDCRAGAS